FRRRSRVSIDKNGQRSCEGLRARVEDKVQLAVAHDHRTEFLPRRCDEESADAHRHAAEPAGIAAQVEDDPIGVAKLPHRFAESRHDLLWIEEGAECDVADVRRELLRFEGDEKGWKVAQLCLYARRFGELQRERDFFVVSIKKRDADVLTDVAGK